MGGVGSNNMDPRVGILEIILISDAEYWGGHLDS